jgi:hypothetical protein
MDIETVIVGIVVLALVAVMYKYWPKGKGLDVNEDGKIDGADAKAAVEVVAAKVVEEVKVEAAKVEEVVVAKYKEELAAFVETETKVAKELVAEVEKVVEEVKAVEAKVEEVVVVEVKKVATKAKAKAKAVEAKAEEVVVAAVKKGGRPKKTV